MKMEGIPFTIYVCFPDTLADWELGYVILNSDSIFQKGRATCIAQNGWLFSRANQYNGRDNNSAQLLN